MTPTDQPSPNPSSSGHQAAQSSNLHAVLSPAIKEGVTMGLAAAGVALSPALEAIIVYELAGALEKQVDKGIDKISQSVANSPKGKFILNTIKDTIQGDTQQDLDHISRAAATEIFPQLTKAFKAIKQKDIGQLAETMAALTDRAKSSSPTETTPTTSPSAPSTLSSRVLAGLSEGEGENAEEVVPPAATNDAANPPETASPAPEESMLPDESAQTAIKKGQENLPQWDLSQKQKEAFARQQLGRQINETEVDETETSLPQTPEGQLQGLEQDVANQYHKVRAKKAKKGIGDKDMPDQDENLDSFQKAVNNLGTKVGEQLKENIKTGHFQSFLIALVLSIMKDLLEWSALFFGDIGFVGTAASTFVGIALFVVFFGEGLWFKRLLVKRFLGRFIITLIAEVIPGFNIFPWYTISVLLLKMKVDKEIRKQKAALKALEEEIKELRKVQKSGGQVSQKKLAKIKARLEELKKVADE